MDSSEDIVDAENQIGGRGDILSFRTIALNQLQRILTLGSKEFHGGFMEKQIKMIGNLKYTEEKYIPDTRQEYINSINALYDISLPHFDKEMTKEAGIIETNKASELKEVKDSTRHSIEMVKHQRLMFQALNKFLYRVNYFASENAEE